MNSKYTYGFKKSKAYGLCGVAIAAFLFSSAQTVLADEAVTTPSSEASLVVQSVDLQNEAAVDQSSDSVLLTESEVAETPLNSTEDIIESSDDNMSSLVSSVEDAKETVEEAIKPDTEESAISSDLTDKDSSEETVIEVEESNTSQVESDLDNKQIIGTEQNETPELDQKKMSQDEQVETSEEDKSEAVAASAGEITEAVAMHRLYNPNSGEHFYTAAVGEKDFLVKVGWKYENIGWYAPKTGESVYRLYNPNAGDHHYTLSSGEKNYLVNVGWKYEGIAWYSAGSSVMYRLYNPNAKTGTHHYTSSKGESDALVKRGWKYEGISWYGVDSNALATPSGNPTQVSAQLNTDGIAISLTSNKVSDYSKVTFSVWSEAKGQNNIKWYKADKSGKTVVNYSTLGDYGNYKVQAYLNENGKLLVLDTDSITIVKPSVKETITKNDDMSYTVTISNVPLYMSSIVLPTWSEKYGQDDIIWTKTNKINSTTYQAVIKLRDHSYDIGKYHLHIYGQSKLGGSHQIGLGATEGFTVKSSDIKLTEPDVIVQNYDKNKGQLTVVVIGGSNSKAIKSVRVAAWSESDRGNLYWYTSSSVKDGQLRLTVDEKYHHNLAGDYQVHVYVTTTDGVEKGRVLGPYHFNKVASQSKVSSTYKGTGVFNLSVDNVYSNGKVVYAVWSDKNGQDDMKWYTATQSGQIANAIVNVTQHTGTGTYHVHVYQNDNGKMYFLTSQDFQVKRTNYDMPYYSQGDSRWGSKTYNYYTMASSGCVPTSLAMVFSSMTGKTVTPVNVADYLYYNTIEFNRSEIGSSGQGVLMATRQWGLTPTALTSFDALASNLKEGHHVVAAVQQNKFSPWGGGMSHEIVLKGFSNGNTYVYDPYNAANNGWYPIISLWNEQSTQGLDLRGVGRPFVKITDN